MSLIKIPSIEMLSLLKTKQLTPNEVMFLIVKLYSFILLRPFAETTED